MKLKLIKLLMITISGLTAAQSPPPPPPTIDAKVLAKEAVTAYQLPSLSGKPLPLTIPSSQYEQRHIPRPDVLNAAARACWPAPALIRAEIDIIGRALKTRVDTGVTYNDYKNYVGVSARIPLYSSNDIDRERQRELQRRESISMAIGELIKSMTEWRLQGRLIDLYRSTEKRAQLRVHTGLAETSEQLAQLEKLASAENARLSARASYEAARLKLIAQCHEGEDSLRNMIDTDYRLD